MLIITSAHCGYSVTILALICAPLSVTELSTKKETTAWTEKKGGFTLQDGGKKVPGSQTMLPLASYCKKA